MIIQPRTWGFICTTAHPAGCAANVRDQIAATLAQGRRGDGPRRVLVIGTSSGYGLAARIVAAFGFGAATLGVFHGKPARRHKPGSAGWYNAAAFEQAAQRAGLTSVALYADAFSHAARACAVELIRKRLGGPVDLVIHSLAAPVRTLPDSGEEIRTVLKPIGEPFHGTTIDTDQNRLVAVTVEAASEQEIADTVTVMGGDDWCRWIDALADAELLAPAARTLAFGYSGPELTWPIYHNGTIGRAKQHVEDCAAAMNRGFGRADFARVAMLKSIVTQSSAAIPVIPLYLSVLRKVLADMGLEENAIEQQNRLFRDGLYRRTHAMATDTDGRLRLDDRELRADVQATCQSLWPRLTDANLRELTDYAGYKAEFLRLFGFGRADVDYTAEIDPLVVFACERAD